MALGCQTGKSTMISLLPRHENMASASTGPDSAQLAVEV